MTLTPTTATSSPTTSVLEVPDPAALPSIVLDLYSSIHKAIRTVLFDVTVLAGRTDPADGAARRELAAAVRSAVDLLESHAEHEDRVIGPVLEQQLPNLAEVIERDHHAFDGRTAYLVHLAEAVVQADAGERAPLARHLYLDLAGFTSAYLVHQDVEEREVMPALQDAIGVPEVVGLHQAIVSSIPPDEMARSMAIMLPAMNVDDRVEMLGGMRAGAPAEVFAGIWGLAGSVLAPADHRTLADRLGIA